MRRIYRLANFWHYIEPATMSARALIINDEPEESELLVHALAGVATTRVAASADAALDRLVKEPFDVVLTDAAMPVMSGLEICARVAEVQPGVPVIIVTGRGDLETAIGAIRAGAFDFVVKPVDVELLRVAVERAVQQRKLRGEVTRLRAALDGKQGKSDIVGTGAAMQRVHDTIARLVNSDASVVISGETGTGKELVARRIHATSGRSRGPFVSINCAAIPEKLLESELFGHVKGAFTDARGSRTGLFVQASGGTLFLDEIAEMPLEMQAKVLRALQERTVRPVGSDVEVPFDARLLAATNRDLEEEVLENRFRGDLFYRINVVHIELPSLRERPADLLELTHHLLAQHAARTGQRPLRLSVPAAARLVAYRWPGNVRELQNCIEHAAAFSRFDEISVDDLPERVRDAGRPKGSSVPPAGSAIDIIPLEELEQRYVERALTILGGNKSRAAELLGIDRRTLYRRFDRWSQGSD